MQIQITQILSSLSDGNLVKLVISLLFLLLIYNVAYEEKNCGMSFFFLYQTPSLPLIYCFVASSNIIRI